MGRTRYTPTQGPFQCYFECGAVLTDKFTRKAADEWEWTTGYANNCVHFCPQCRFTRRREIAEIMRIIQQRPEGFPQNKVQIGSTISESAALTRPPSAQKEDGK